MSTPATDINPTEASTRGEYGPLAVGVIVAVLLHALLIPLAVFNQYRIANDHVTWRTGERDPTKNTELEDQKRDILNRLLPPPPKLRIGQDGSKASSLAWIAHDDFQELIAPKGQVPQPALQSMVDPQPDAAVRPDPTPPKPAAQPSNAQQTIAQQNAPQHTPAPQTGEQAKPEAPPQPGVAKDALAGLQQPSPLPETDPTPLGQLAMADTSERTLNAPEPSMDAGTPNPPKPKDDETPSNAQGAKGQPSEQPPQPAAAPNPATTASASSPASPEPAKPTSAARSESESAAFSLNNTPVRVQPGRVLASDGLEIKTFHPRFSTIALSSSIPRNPEARIVFDHKTGNVLEAQLTKSSDYPNIDGPILASLYRWKASGSRLKDFDKPIALKVYLILSERE